MGFIEVVDGLTKRRIPVPEFGGAIRIDVSGSDGPRVTVPESATVRRNGTDAPTATTTDQDGAPDPTQRRQP